ncbi:hypothetical protein Pint_22161 [Pistacia integerrima]|uniref:Uncharacterized protein n=1 Tax=Pistacia integerrima TaxID=434235 RepID=A0ACC0YNH2_9ROSI|nr:hypothetical protein Pint_22161 [Pistacia integerrima]
MGLHQDLNDLAADSFPVLVLALFANCVATVWSLLNGFLHSLGLTRLYPDDIDAGLSGLIILKEQLKINGRFSYEYSCDSGGGGGKKECVVCLCKFRDGERVRKLDCCHVFHKDCFDGWLNHRNFNCPLCRSPLGSAPSNQSVCGTRTHVTEDFVEWLSSPLRR